MGPLINNDEFWVEICGQAKVASLTDLIGGLMTRADELPGDGFHEAAGDLNALLDYFLFYNQDRPHQGLHNQVPADLYLGKEMPIENKNAIHLKFAQNWS